MHRLLTDKDFTVDRASWLFHAALGKWIDKKQGTRVLEVGCGPGRYAAMLQTLGFEVTAVDPFPFPEWSMVRAQGGTVFMDRIKAESLPFRDQCFDHVTCIGTLLYVGDVEKSLAEMRRVLRPGGRILLRTVNRTNRYTRRTGRKLDPASNHLFTLPELVRSVEAAGFEVERQFAFGFFPSAAPSFWWYFSNVWLTDGIMEKLGSLGPPDARHHCIVWATRR
jgi:ubiquinone/menaquinone biosynthesis C-methylase UbiE